MAFDAGALVLADRLGGPAVGRPVGRWVAKYAGTPARARDYVVRVELPAMKIPSGAVCANADYSHPIRLNRHHRPQHTVTISPSAPKYP